MFVCVHVSMYVGTYVIMDICMQVFNPRVQGSYSHGLSTSHPNSILHLPSMWSYLMCPPNKTIASYHPYTFFHNTIVNACVLDIEDYIAVLV